jgi:hypothetical protein
MVDFVTAEEDGKSVATGNTVEEMATVVEVRGEVVGVEMVDVVAVVVDDLLVVVLGGSSSPSLDGVLVANTDEVGLASSSSSSSSRFILYLPIVNEQPVSQHRRRRWRSTPVVDQKHPRRPKNKRPHPPISQRIKTLHSSTASLIIVITP